MQFTHSQLQRAVHQIHPVVRLVSFQQMTGGISAYMYRLEVVAEDTSHTWVLRAHSEEVRQYNPIITRAEYYLHGHVRMSGVPAPRPLHEESSLYIFPIPYFIMDYVEHDDLIPPSLSKSLAEMLIKIHTVDLKRFNFGYLPDAVKRLEYQLNRRGVDMIQHTLKHALPHIVQNRPVLLHGDYWLGNLLWKDGKIVSVLDWEDMMRGDPLVDLGKSRLELLWAYDNRVVNDYTKYYQSQMPSVDMTYLPFWDLWGAYRLADFADWFDDTEKIRSMQEKYDGFVDSAITQLSALLPDE